ncbi:MAG: hypothetical protein ACR2GX_05225 [Candidatus Dormibacteria bacterium]
MTEIPEPATPEPEDLVARALRRFIHQLPGEDTKAGPETSPKMQPWAETASPTATGKRPLDELLKEFSARIAAHPDALVTPSGNSPQAAFFQRFSRQDPSAERTGSSGRRRRRRRDGPTGAATSAPQGQGGRGRGRNGGEGRPGRGADPGESGTSQPSSSPPGRTSRRSGRRGGRRRGGGGAPGVAGGGGG